MWQHCTTTCSMVIPALLSMAIKTVTESSLRWTLLLFITRCWTVRAPVARPESQWMITWISRRGQHLCSTCGKIPRTWSLSPSMVWMRTCMCSCAVAASGFSKTSTPAIRQVLNRMEASRRLGCVVPTMPMPMSITLMCPTTLLLAAASTLAATKPWR